MVVVDVGQQLLIYVCTVAQYAEIVSFDVHLCFTVRKEIPPYIQFLPHRMRLLMAVCKNQPLISWYFMA